MSTVCPSVQRRSRAVIRTAALLVGVTCSLAASNPAAAQNVVSAPAWAQNQPPVRGFHATPTVNLRVFVPTGRVRIGVWDRDSIMVSGTIGAASSMFGGGRADYVKFGVAPLRTDDPNLAEADWLVTVPRRAHVWVKMTVGSIETDSTEGELELYAVGGSISVRRASGVVSVESIDAGVRIDGVRGDLRIRAGKAVTAINDATGTASVTSVSGGVTLSGRTPECRVETIGGDIVFDASQLSGAVAELQTHSGTIRVGIDDRRPPLLELSSRSGRVSKISSSGIAANGRVVARSFRGAVTIEASPPRRMR